MKKTGILIILFSIFSLNTHACKVFVDVDVKQGLISSDVHDDLKTYVTNLVFEKKFVGAIVDKAEDAHLNLSLRVTGRTSTDYFHQTRFYPSVSRILSDFNGQVSYETFVGKKSKSKIKAYSLKNIKNVLKKSVDTIKSCDA